MTLRRNGVLVVREPVHLLGLHRHLAAGPGPTFCGRRFRPFRGPFRQPAADDSQTTRRACLPRQLPLRSALRRAVSSNYCALAARPDPGENNLLKPTRRAYRTRRRNTAKSSPSFFSCWTSIWLFFFAGYTNVQRTSFVYLSLIYLYILLAVEI